MESDRAYMHSGGARLFEMPGSDIRITGYLKKMKTMKKKFFVLRSTSSSGPARLEYYDSEKKFTSGQPPKRVVQLHTCFNINRKSDSRHKHAIALYTKEECFSVVCEDEKEQELWLDLMLDYQNEFIQEGGGGSGDYRGREHYDFVWQVTIQAKGLGQSMNIRGPYRLCLNRHSIYLFKLNMDKPHYIFQLETVRSVGHQDNVFKLVVGKISPTGEGELLMHSDDSVITQNIHETILDFMKNMDRRQDSFERRTVSESLHGSASSLSRPPPEFRHRSETFTQGSNRTRPRVERPMSVCTRSARSTSHLQTAISPCSSPHIHGFMDHQIMGSHRFRSNSNDSKASRASFSAASDDLMHDHHCLVMRPALQEEPDFDCSLGLDTSLGFTSPDSLQLECDDEGQGGDSYMDMNSGTTTSPFPSIMGYVDMAPCTHKDVEVKEVWRNADQGSAYLPMAPSTRSSSAPIPIHPPHGDHGGYLDMTMHSVLPPVKEGGSAEGYVPMSPVFNASSYGCDGSQIKPDRVKCMLADDYGSDFTQPPTRTYSLGSRPASKPRSGSGVKAGGYMDMSRGGAEGGGGGKKADNGRSCSAPHLMHPQHHQHQRSGRSGSRVDSPTPTPTPSASPLSVSLRSDDSDAFMELDFYRPRTASDSYSYRPCASSFGGAGQQGQGHRPRSSSHGQGTRPLRLRQHRTLGECLGRLNPEAVPRSHNASQGSLDSFKASSSESLKKPPQEGRSKTAQLGTPGYMDMSGGGGGGGADKRFTPSPQPPGFTPTAHRSEQEAYVNMSLGKHEGYVDMTLGTPRSAAPGFKPSSGKAGAGDNSQDSDNPNTSFSFGGGGGASSSSSVPGQDSVYINLDSSDGAVKKECPLPRSATCDGSQAYIMYEPAPPAGSGVGKENVPSSSSSSTPVPKERPGSGKEGKKRGGFFSLRHGPGDSGKHAPKKSDSGQTGGVVYAATGEQQFGSLGRDFRKKSKDLSKAARQKSSSFSKTFGIRASKPGKLLRKSPTPPSSLEGNDEYIEFLPTAGKSDSDSSHSSGSIQVTPPARPEAVSASQDAAYVGFEPGNIPLSLPQASSGQQAPAIPAANTATYLPMNFSLGAEGGVGGQSKGFTVTKPSKKSGRGGGGSRCKSKEGSRLAAASPPTAQPPTPRGPWELGKTVDSGSLTGSPLPCTCASPPGQSTSALGGQFSVVRPQCSDSSQPAACGGGDSAVSVCGTACLMPPLPALPVVPALGKDWACSPAANPTLSGGTTDAAAVVLSSEAWRLVEGCVQSVPHPVPQSSSTTHGPGCSVSPCPPSAQSSAPPHSSASLSASPVSSTCAPPLSSVCTALSSVCSGTPPLSSGQTSSLAPASLHSDPQSGGGYMHFDPATLAGAMTSATTAGVCEVTPAVVISCITASTTHPPTCATSTKSAGMDMAQSASPKSTSAGPSDVGQLQPSPAGSGSGSSFSSGSSSANPVSRKGSGKEVRSRRKSGGGKTPTTTPATQTVPAPNNGGDPSSVENSCTGGGSGWGTGEPSGQCEGGVSSGGGAGGLLRLDCMTLGSSPGIGRGRHNSSSSSVGVHQASTGNNRTAAGGGHQGELKPINTGTDTRHSISDLSGCQQMTFPSNALSRQLPSPSLATPHQGALNYAKLDLSSTDSLGEGSVEGVRSPRNRSRHSSAADEKLTPLSYATIDFEKSKEALLNSASKDVKLIV